MSTSINAPGTRLITGTHYEARERANLTAGHRCVKEELPSLAFVRRSIKLLNIPL